MDINEVPQDPMQYKGRETINKLMYAVDKDGKYTGVTSAGWMPEHIAMRQAWEEVDAGLAEIKAQVHAGKLSPLAYFMHKNMMDVPLLASYVGKWQWQVRRHLKPAGFNKLSDGMLQRYASVLNTTTEALNFFDSGAE